MPGDRLDRRDLFVRHRSVLGAPTHRRNDLAAILGLELSGDDTGHVGAVPRDVAAGALFQIILGGVAGSREIAVAKRQVEVEIGVFLEMRMCAVDAGIDHRPDDVLAEGAERIVRRIGLHRAAGQVGEALHFVIEPDPVYRGCAGHALLGGLLSLAFVAADEFADIFPAELAEQILLAVQALAAIDRLPLVFVAPGRGTRRQTPRRAGGDDPRQLLDPCPDVVARLLPTTGIFRDLHR